MSNKIIEGLKKIWNMENYPITYDLDDGTTINVVFDERINKFISYIQFYGNERMYYIETQKEVDDLNHRINDVISYYNDNGKYPTIEYLLFTKPSLKPKYSCISFSIKKQEYYTWIIIDKKRYNLGYHKSEQYTIKVRQHIEQYFEEYGKYETIRYIESKEWMDDIV